MGELSRQNKELLKQVESLTSQNRGFSTQKKDLIGQKKALSAKNKLLISKMKDLTLKNDELERQASLRKENLGGEAEAVKEYERQVEEARQETKKWKERNNEVVASLERVET